MNFRDNGTNRLINGSEIHDRVRLLRTHRTEKQMKKGKY